MKIRLNGDPFEIAGPLSLSALLADLKIEPRRVAVEHNLAIIKRARYDTTLVQDGDTVEIVNFVGGGETPRRTAHRRKPQKPAKIEPCSMIPSSLPARRSARG